VTPEEAAAHVAHIREVVARSRAERAEGGDIYVVWGLVVIAADLVTLAFEHGWVAWPLLTPIGWAYAAWSGSRREAAVRTFGGRVEARLWIASGLGWGAVLVSSAVAGLLSVELIVPLVCGAVAVAMLTSGTLFASRFLTGSGLVFAAVGTVGPWLPVVPQHLLFDAAILLTYVAPQVVGWLRRDA
jgi:hypothetical protein